MVAYLYEFGKCNAFFCLHFHVILRSGSNLPCLHFLCVFRSGSDINMFPDFAIYTHIWKWYHVACDLKRFSLLEFMYLDMAAYLYEFGNCNVLFCLRFSLNTQSWKQSSMPAFSFMCIQIWEWYTAIPLFWCRNLVFVLLRTLIHPFCSVIHYQSLLTVGAYSPVRNVKLDSLTNCHHVVVRLPTISP